MSTKTHGHHHPTSSSHIGQSVVTEHSTEHGSPVNDADRINLIKTRAYGLWEQAGKPDGDLERERFWCEAEKHVVAPVTKGQ